jgi:F-box/leucine-rich repeat protein 18
MSREEEAVAEAAGDTHLLGFSDEILLHILSHVPKDQLND